MNTPRNIQLENAWRRVALCFVCELIEFTGIYDRCSSACKDTNDVKARNDALQLALTHRFAGVVLSEMHIRLSQALQISDMSTEYRDHGSEHVTWSTSIMFLAFLRFDELSF